ncbi:hypothetical protein Dimus_000365 [Dionaea muscipula]
MFSPPTSALASTATAAAATFYSGSHGGRKTGNGGSFGWRCIGRVGTCDRQLPVWVDDEKERCFEMGK